MRYALPDPAQTMQLLQHAAPVTAVLDALCLSWRIVGGAARGLVCGEVASDVDIEVVADHVDTVWEGVGAQFPHAMLVAGDKPVVRIRIDRQWFDVSVTAHADFAVSAAQRDFTMNAMAVCRDGSFLDPFAGIKDLQAGIIRHIGDAFVVDPLRVLRLMRFAGIYDLAVAPLTAQAAHAALPYAATLKPERVWGEWQAWALRSKAPGRGLAVLAACGWLAHYPLLQALVGCAQDPIYHPEGNVWVHTGYVCDAASQAAALLHDHDRVVLMLAALCHDLGKPQTTTVDASGRIISPQHASVGVPLTRAMLEQINVPARYVAPVCALVHEHMVRLGVTPSERAVRRLAQRLAPATIQLWGLLVNADAAGRPPLPATDSAAPVLALAHTLGIQHHKPVALVRGTDVLALGVAPGPAVGRWLQLAYEAQLDGVFHTTETGIAWLHQHLIGSQKTD